MATTTSLMDVVGIVRGEHPPSVEYGVLQGEVHGKTRWKKFVRYLVTANPDLFYNIAGHLGTFDIYAGALAENVRLTFGYRGEAYSLSRFDGGALLELPLMVLPSIHAESFTLDNLRKAINRLLVMVRKASMPVVARGLCFELPELTDSQLLADMRSQCRVGHSLNNALDVVIHNGALRLMRVSPHGVRKILAGLQCAYPSEFDEGIRFLDGGSTLPVWAMYDVDMATPSNGGWLRFADYDYDMSKCSELQFRAQQAVLRAGGCSPENICAKTTDLINTLIKQEN